MSGTSDLIEVPLRYPTSTFYVDESGAKTSAGSFFVVGAVKLRAHGKLGRAIQDIRDKTRFHREFKFSNITNGALPAYYALVDELERSDAHIAACVAGRRAGPRDKRPAWLVQAQVTEGLLRGNINRGELVTALIDVVSTPPNVAYEDYIKERVNKRLDRTAIVSAACLDSRTCAGLQVADLIASAVGFQRRHDAGVSGSDHSPKAKVARRLQAAFGVDFTDTRTDRVSIRTIDVTPRGKDTKLRVVESVKKAG